MENLDNEKIYDAIKNGVKEAFKEKLELIDVDDAIECGTWTAFKNALPETNDLKDIYFDAILKSQ